MAKKNENPVSREIVNTPTVDKKGRINLPFKEWKDFLSKNEISEHPEKLFIIANDTLDGFWGMTEEMFEKLATAFRKKDRDSVKFLYDGLCSVNLSRSSRLSPLTRMVDLGFFDFSHGERFNFACSQHEDYEGLGYFLRLKVAKVLEDRIEFPEVRTRILKILGEEFLNFSAKMRE